MSTAIKGEIYEKSLRGVTLCQAHMRIKTGCEFDDYWTNQEGWLVQDDGKLVCLDWDEYCTKCRVDDSKDCTFTVASNNNP